MRRAAAALLLLTALVTGCSHGSSSRAQPHASLASASASPPGVDPGDLIRPEVVRGASSPRCPRRTTPPETVPAKSWDFNGDGRGDTIVSWDGGGERESFDVLHVLMTSRQGTADCDEPLVGHLYRFWWPASGDFNRDGYADVAYAGDLNGSGTVVVIPGGPSGLVASQAMQVASQQFDEFVYRPDGVPTPRPGGVRYWFGRSLAVADFDRDGYDDLAIGAPQTAPMTASGGSIVVLWGGPNGLQARQPGSRPDRYEIRSDLPSFGTSLAAGDVDGDGYPDLIESSDRDAYSGFGKPRLTLIPGGAQGPRKPVVIGRGYGLVQVGDLTGDGIDDVAVTDPMGFGRILLYVGGTVGLLRPIVIAPGRDGLPVRPHLNDLFTAAAIIPDTGGRPGMLVVRIYLKVRPDQSSERLVLVPGSATGVKPANAHVAARYLGDVHMVHDIVGDSRPELFVAKSVGPHRTGYAVLQPTDSGVRRHLYVVLPRRLDADHLPVPLVRPPTR